MKKLPILIFLFIMASAFCTSMCSFRSASDRIEADVNNALELALCGKYTILMRVKYPKFFFIFIFFIIPLLSKLKMMKKCILMVRVSTEQQTYDAQMQELHELAIKSVIP